MRGGGGRDYEEAWGKSGGDRCVHYFDCADGFTSVYICQYNKVYIYKVYVNYISINLFSKRLTNYDY